MYLTGNSHLSVTRCSCVSRAPSHLTLSGGLPAFLNLHGIKSSHSSIDSARYIFEFFKACY